MHPAVSRQLLAVSRQLIYISAMPELSREDVCQRTAAALRAADPAEVNAVVGFDGFVDNLMQAVDRRMSAEAFEPIHTIDAFGQRISASAGHSSNVELVLKQQKLGGNGPIFANALATLGLGVTYVGNLGHPTVHPIFDAFTKAATVHSIAEPGITDAVEFDDGKLMLGKLEHLAGVTWNNVVDRVNLPTFVAACEKASLIGMANWTMLPHLSDVWRHMLDEVMPNLTKKRRHVFVDLADPAKRTDEDLKHALDLLGEFQQHGGVVLGLNAGEAKRVATLLGCGEFQNNRPMAKAIRDTLNIDAIVIHSRHGAAGVTAKETQTMQGPFVKRPKVTTGAGDHFNSGFCLGLSLELPLVDSLCCGVAAGGYYVSRGASPTLAQLADFIERLPAPEEGA